MPRAHTFSREQPGHQGGEVGGACFVEQGADMGSHGVHGEAEVIGDKLALTVRVVVFFGYPFKKLAEAVRAAVVAAIDAQVGVEVERVDVCIDGLVFPKE